MTESAVLEQIEMVGGVVGAAAATLASGHFVDMTGLDRAVAELCAAAQALPPRYQRRTALRLQRLALDLSALAEALSEQRARVEQASEAEARRRAESAYQAEPGR